VPCVVQLGRETRSPLVVAVSDRAVLDQDTSHERNLQLGGRPLDHVHAARGGRLAHELVPGRFE
jgi:hypothetical protein